MIDSAFYGDSQAVHLWITLLFLATHSPRQIHWLGKTITLQPGQFITGRLKLAEMTNIHQSQVYRILKRLEIEHQIEQQKSNVSSLVTICNWDRYQNTEQQNEQPLNNQRTTNEQPLNTNKNGKKEKNERNGRFAVPRLEEILEAAKELGLPESEANSFFDYYEANGWHVGKSNMRKWQPTLRNWKRRWEERGGKVQETQPGLFSKRTFEQICNAADATVTEILDMTEEQKSLYSRRHNA